MTKPKITGKTTLAAKRLKKFRDDFLARKRSGATAVRPLDTSSESVINIANDGGLVLLTPKSEPLEEPGSGVGPVWKEHQLETAENADSTSLLRPAAVSTFLRTYSKKKPLQPYALQEKISVNPITPVEYDKNIPLEERIDRLMVPCSCRLCLGEITSFATPIWGDSGIYEIVLRCSAVNVLETDQFQFVCLSCKYQLDYVNKFQQMCLKSNEMFLKTTFIKKENPLPDSLNGDEIFLEPLRENNIKLEDNHCHGVEKDIFDTSAYFEIELTDQPSEDQNHIEEIHCLGDKDDFDTATNFEIKDEMVREYPCGKCPMISFNKEEYRVHYVSHYEQTKKIKPQIDLCPICGISLKYNKLSQHIKLHTDPQRLLKCDECDKMYSGRSALKQHKLRHRPVELQNCTLCGGKFTTKGGLKRHMGSAHSQNPLNSCPYCDRKFNCLYNMRVHLRTHTGEVPYACPDCGLSFAHRVTMKLHRLKEHKVDMFDPPTQKDRIKRKKKKNKQENKVAPSQDA